MQLIESALYETENLLSICTRYVSSLWNREIAIKVHFHKNRYNATKMMNLWKSTMGNYVLHTRS